MIETRAGELIDQAETTGCPVVSLTAQGRKCLQGARSEARLRRDLFHACRSSFAVNHAPIVPTASPHDAEHFVSGETLKDYRKSCVTDSYGRWVAV
jgi:hypothetical protein